MSDAPDPMLRSVFASAPEPADEGFSVAVAGRVARHERLRCVTLVMMGAGALTALAGLTVGAREALAVLQLANPQRWIVLPIPAIPSDAMATVASAAPVLIALAVLAVAIPLTRAQG